MNVEPGGCVQRGGGFAVGGVGADEAGQRDRPGLGEQPCDVSGAADVLAAGVLVEAEVAVEAVAEVVAVEQERGATGEDEAFLDGARDRGLAGGRQPGEPQGRADALQGLPALVAAQGGALPAHVGAALGLVVGLVAVDGRVAQLQWAIDGRHRAITTFAKDCRQVSKP